jgi:hypothetical protein
MLLISFAVGDFRNCGSKVLCHGFRQLVSAFLLQMLGFIPGSVHVGLVVGNGTGTNFSLSSSVFSSVSFHYDCPYSCIIWQINNRPVGSHSSETLSHTIDMNRSMVLCCVFCF